MSNHRETKSYAKKGTGAKWHRHLSCNVDMPLPEKVGCLDMDEGKIISDESVRKEILKRCGASNITEFLLHSKERQKDIIRDVMRELGQAPGKCPALAECLTQHYIRYGKRCDSRVGSKTSPLYDPHRTRTAPPSPPHSK
jgi:hypothetical protein